MIIFSNLFGVTLQSHLILLNMKFIYNKFWKIVSISHFFGFLHLFLFYYYFSLSGGESSLLYFLREKGLVNSLQVITGNDNDDVGDYVPLHLAACSLFLYNSQDVELKRYSNCLMCFISISS